MVALYGLLFIHIKMRSLTVSGHFLSLCQSSVTNEHAARQVTFSSEYAVVVVVSLRFKACTMMDDP